MSRFVVTEESLTAKFEALLPHLDERQRRLLLGAEARMLGHGGGRLVARAAGVREATVSRGVAELESGELGPRLSHTALVAPMPPLDQPGALGQLGAPGWYYPLALRAPWALRTLYAGLAALAKWDPRRAERLLVGGMSQADQQLFSRSEWAGRFGADLAGAGSRGIADDEHLMPQPWGFAPEQVKSPVRLWLGEHDKLVPTRVWLERPSSFPVCDTTVVPSAGHFLIAEHMTEIVGTV